MEERAHAIGGALQIVTGIGKGTTIRVRIPTQSVLDSAAEATPEYAASPRQRARGIG
jgi:hypothetical protein